MLLQIAGDVFMKTQFLSKHSDIFVLQVISYVQLQADSTQDGIRNVHDISRPVRRIIKLLCQFQGFSGLSLQHSPAPTLKCEHLPQCSSHSAARCQAGSFHRLCCKKKKKKKKLKTKGLLYSTSLFVYNHGSYAVNTNFFRIAGLARWISLTPGRE